MPSFKHRLALISGFTASVVLVFGALTGTASASTHAQPSKGYCYTVVAKVNPPAPASHVVARGCYSTRAQATRAESRLARADVPLVTFYENEGYTGFSDTIYGHDGACDSAGYGLSNLSYENVFVIGGISSYKTHSSCDGQRYYKETNYNSLCKTFFQTSNVNYVGALCNDDLNSMKVWNST